MNTKHNTSVSLSEHLAAFVSSQVADGRYDNASDVVRSGLRLLEEKEAKLRTLRQALQDGEVSGTATAFDFASFRESKQS